MTDALHTWTRGRTRVVLAAWAWLAAATILSSDAFAVGGDVTWLVMLVAGLVIGVAWSIATLLWLGNLGTWRRVLLWLTVPSAPVVALVGAHTGWPMAARVWLCESALREHAETKPEDRGPKRVGLFWVDDAYPEGHGAMLFSTGRSLHAHGGLLYVPNEWPAGFSDSGRAELTHLYGPWYRCRVWLYR